MFNEFILENEVIIRLIFFFGIFTLMATWEMKAPKRTLSISKVTRWINNLGLVFLNSLILRVLFPAAAVGVALFAQNNSWGLFNYYDISLFSETIISIIVMDFIIYMQHVMVHAVPLLWRLHRVHHADLDYDVTTGARFHTFEIILSMLIKFATILLLGAPVIAVIIFEIILNALAMFNHGNVGLSKSLDSKLRFLLVTPDMHRVHHSIEEDETNSNFGFNLTWWDKIFGTYREDVRVGQKDMIIGIKTFRDYKETNKILGMLMMPFKGKLGKYSINSKKEIM